MPQGREIFPHLTVEENLRVSLLGCGRARDLDDGLGGAWSVSEMGAGRTNRSRRRRVVVWEKVDGYGLEFVDVGLAVDRL